MAAMVAQGELARRLCVALGLERCVSFKISGGVYEVLTVEAKCHTEEGQLEKVVKVLEEWEK